MVHLRKTNWFGIPDVIHLSTSASESNQDGSCIGSPLAEDRNTEIVNAFKGQHVNEIGEFGHGRSAHMQTIS
jgi:hypothetical protein